MEAEKAATQTAGESIAEEPLGAADADIERPLRLIVGYDGRPGSRDALCFAKGLCEKAEVELTVASMTEEDEQWIGHGSCDVLGSTPFSTRLIAGGHGHAATALKELAEAEGSDIIVVGSTHRGRIGSVFPGSVGGCVFDGAPCAVAIAPRGLAESDFSIQTIAIGYDGSRASATALRLAVGLAERTDASLLILGAVEISLGLAGFETRQPKGFQRSQMEHHLQRALEKVPSTVSAESRLLLGDPAEKIVEAVGEADLLIIGSKGSYGIVPRLMLGNVGAAVVKGAPSPTLITPTDS